MSTQTGIPSLNRRLVRESERVRLRELLLVVLLSVTILLPVLAYVWQNVEWIQIGYRIEKLKSQRDRLVEARHRLELETASLESLVRIERVSVDQLGLTPPPDDMVVLMDRKRLEPDPATASSRIAETRASGIRQRGADGRILEAH
jgi:cell division protein FtsL